MIKKRYLDYTYSIGPGVFPSNYHATEQTAINSIQVFKDTRFRKMTNDKDQIVRRLAAILSTDVKGYSRLMGDDEMATVETITRYRAFISEFVEHHNGRVVDSPGDNLLAEFASAVDALDCAVAMQEKLADGQRRLLHRLCGPSAWTPVGTSAFPII